MHMQPTRRSACRPTLTINVPNILTVLRILITPIFVILLLRDLHGLALLVFVLAGVSDGLDGLIARMFNQRSDLGAVLDPIADKLLLSAAYVSLGVLRDIPGWLVVVVISRDVLIVTGIAVLHFCRIDFDVLPPKGRLPGKPSSRAWRPMSSTSSGSSTCSSMIWSIAFRPCGSYRVPRCLRSSS